MQFETSLSTLAVAFLAAAIPSGARPLAAPPVDPAPAELSWFDGTLPRAVARARDEDRMVAVYFWRNGSEYCAKLYQETLQDERAVAALGSFVLLSADHGDSMGASLMEEFNVQTLPFLLFVGPDGQPEDSIAGFLPAEDLVEQLARIRRGEGTRSDLEARLAAAPKGTAEDFELRFALAGKHQELGNQARHDEIIASVREEDPERSTVYGARAFLWKIQGQVFVDASAAAGYPDGAGGDPERFREIAAHLDLEPLYDHAARVRLDESRYEAWAAIASTEGTRESYENSCRALGKAWKYVPEDQALGFALNASQRVMAMPIEPSSREKKFVVQLADRAWELARDEHEGGEEGSEADRKRYLASVLAQVAGAYRYAGKSKKAESLLEDCTELDPHGEYDSMLASWRE